MRRVLSLVMVVLMLAACDGDDSSGPDRNLQIAGSYTLESINGTPPPIALVFVSGAYIIEQVSGSVVLGADSSYKEDGLLRERINAQDSVVTNFLPYTILGRWSAEDSVIVVTESGSNGGTGFGFFSQSENRLTLSFEADTSLYTYIYRKD